MAGKSKRAALLMTVGELELIQTIANSRTQPRRKVIRAQILFRYQAGQTISQIAAGVAICRDTVYDCVDKALAMGIEAALEDLPHSPKDPVITPEAKAWVIHLACSKPTAQGYAAELWTRQSLANQVRAQAVASGHPSLARAAKATRLATRCSGAPDGGTGLRIQTPGDLFHPGGLGFTRRAHLRLRGT
jgi:hypothetical protein